MRKKSCLSTAVALGLGAGTAQATVFNMTFMDCYTTTCDNPNVTGTVNTAGGGSGSFNSGGTLFFGHEWTATVVETFETTGPGTWSFTTADGASTTNSYTFTLAPGQVAMGLLFDWNNNIGDPILNIVNADGSGVDMDSDGMLGTYGCCGPIWYDAPTVGFAGVVAVPVPGAAWLFGTGLAALAGIARRRLA